MNTCIFYPIFSPYRNTDLTNIALVVTKHDTIYKETNHPDKIHVYNYLSVLGCRSQNQPQVVFTIS